MKYLSLAVVAALALPSAAVLAKDPKAPSAVVASGKEKLWNDGSKREAKGREKVDDAAKDTRKAETKKRKGEDKIAEGKAKIATAEESYKRYLTQLTPASDPKGAKAQAEGLKDSANRWQDALDQVRDGEKDMREADDSMAKAARAKAEGEAMIAEGRSIKSQAGDTLVPSILPGAITPPSL
jgi:hypothetical protein